MRGNRRRPEPLRRAERSIPACAGQPSSRCSPITLPAVYPRVCGATTIRRAARPSSMGLSPRVRGNRYRRSHGVDHRRSIPACAGQPGMMSAAHSHGKVYPRVCGATACLLFSHASPRSLSPRVRGNRCGKRYPVERPGSIPACAGQPVLCLCRLCACQVYPRVCGATAPEAIDATPEPGLSPRVRGNPPSRPTQNKAYRSIPACAGQPALVEPCILAGTVYPRVCGATLPCLYPSP